MDNFKQFINMGCEYYPCHKGAKINCLFCFCPLYHDEGCGGAFSYTTIKGKRVKDCSSCQLPHEAEGYDYIINKLKS